MNYYSQEPVPEESRLSVSSVILLAIFIGAVALIVYAWIAMPWASDDTPAIRSGDLGEVAVGEQIPAEEDGTVAEQAAPAAADDSEVALQPAP
ncbi:MAG TPA: hypothetical protein VMR52_00395 [Dehalococcoidia bacterium]|nr:hypothetical protein [Dehalococcoidia bacterium]